VAPDPLALAPLEENNYFATVAVCAYLLERLNRLPEALDLLFQVVFSKPDTPYLDWAVAWLEKPEAARPEAVPPLRQFLAQVAERLPELAGTEGAPAAVLDRLPRLVLAGVAAFPGEEDLH